MSSRRRAPTAATRMAVAAMPTSTSAPDHTLVGPLPGLTFWRESPISGTCHVYRHDPRHQRHRATALSAGAIRSGEVAICLGLPGANREQGRRCGAVAEPSLEDYRRTGTPAGGQGQGRGRRDAAAGAGWGLRVHLGNAALDALGLHGRVLPDGE